MQTQAANIDHKSRHRYAEANGYTTIWSDSDDEFWAVRPEGGRGICISVCADGSYEARFCDTDGESIGASRGVGADMDTALSNLALS